MFGSRLKKYDVHVKVVEGVSQQTSVGAMVTLLCLGLTCFLIFGEMKSLFQSNRSYHVELDQISSKEYVKLHYDVEFNQMKCSELMFSQEVTRGTVHQFSNSDKDLNLEDVGSGCRVKGTVITDKVGGNFRFKVRPSGTNSPPNPISETPSPSQYPNLDLSHRVHNVYFEGEHDLVTKLLGSVASPPTPLKNQATHLNAETGLYHYGLQIVPSKKKRNGALRAADLNSYSISERSIKLSELNRPLSLGGAVLQNFVGIIFTYEFYPVAVVTEVNNEGILQFLVSLCAIVGGLVTVMSLVDKCLHRSVKAIIGKKD